ncbi:O-antigen ligase family protein [Clostridium sp. Sa3CUN1]|uniref:O-antigen ligase family protein n=1 Tax=Clostridium gallinarum TaxID=2762246 RepID=A0ABR8Q2T1_9CLOT|nr:O-antigen ligase family protein [Clostridium gallinarum]MBD7914725.1 O-antigen ligase family protein [Clostridium gallinarum]
MKKYLLNVYDFFSNSFYLKLLYLLVSLSYVTIIFDFPFFKILNKICLLWVAFLFIINFVGIIRRKRKIYIFNIFLYLFLAVTLFFTIYKYPTDLNYKTWLMNVLIFTVIFSIDNYKDKETIKNEINIYSFFYIAFSFIASLSSLVLIFLNKNIVINIINSDGVEETLYFIGIFKNENSLGVAAAISIVLGIYLLSKSKLKKVNIFLIINTILQGVTLVLSSGRSGYLIILSLIFIFAFVYIENNFIRTLMVVLPIVFIYFIFKLDDKTLHYIFTGREYIWIAAIRIIKFSFFSGIGTSNTIPTLIQNQPAELIGVTKGGIHNIYMEITTTNGFIATFMLILFISTLILFATSKIQKMNSKDKITNCILLGLLLGIPVVNLMESNLVYIISFISLIYWFYAGNFIALLYKEEN